MKINKLKRQGLFGIGLVAFLGASTAFASTPPEELIRFESQHEKISGPSIETVSPQQAEAPVRQVLPQARRIQYEKMTRARTNTATASQQFLAIDGDNDTLRNAQEVIRLLEKILEQR